MSFCIIVMTLAYLCYRFRGLSAMQGVPGGLRPAVIAMIASAGISLLILSFYGQRELPADFSGIDPFAVCIFTAALIILRRRKPNPIFVIGNMPESA